MKFIKRLIGQASTVVAVIAAAAFGYGVHAFLTPPPAEPMQNHAEITEPEVVWTCSMHLQIRQPEQGLCPICNMDLVPAESYGSGDGDVPQFKPSPGAAALMRIETALVERRFVTTEVRMVGTVEYDETRLASITAWVPGRIDELFVDYTGVKVNKGDHMVYLYSPDILNAQDELRRAARTVASLKTSSPEVLKQTAQTTLEAARSKLQRWGLTEGQISAAEKGGSDSDHVTIFAPIGGTVIERNGQEGMYVETGTLIYTIADLTSVWVNLHAYESDLPWLHYGQTVTFTTESNPGNSIEGKIAFIDPVLDRDTRTVNVRVNVPNSDGTLKPGMFVRSIVAAQVATNDRIMDPALAGKWISPMHPEIVKDGPGNCDICGMALVKAETLGYVNADADDAARPLVIPASAPLVTGKRALVYVEIPDADVPTYEPRYIELGPRAGDDYIVESGLAEGDRVVTHGNFKIDSDLQIRGEPSMMNPQGGSAGGGAHDHAHMEGV
jgi:Cu(I)/Ag(I) efflux system membrane fusion protein